EASRLNSSAGRARGPRGWLIVAAITSTAIVALALSWTRASFSGRGQRPEMRVEIMTPPTTDPVSFAISPDGQQLVFVATSESRKSQLWLRSLTVEGSHPLEGTEGARHPFWSPDSRAVGFFSDQKLKRIDLEGRAIQTIAAAVAGRGGAWNRYNVIVFASSGGSALSRVAAGGGEPTAVTQHTGGTGSGHRFPQFLPDQEHFLFYAASEHGEYV